MVGWVFKVHAAHALTRKLSKRRGLVFSFATPPQSLSTTIRHIQTHQCVACLHTIWECDLRRVRAHSRGDTYHQLDLLGRAAVGVGGCRVVRFALAAGVHGGALQGCLVGRIVRASAILGPRTVCDRGVRARGLMSLSLL